MGSVIKNILIRVGADIQGYQKNLAKAQSVMTGFAAQQKKVLSTMNANTKNLTTQAGASMAGLAGAMMIARGGALAVAAAMAVVATAAASGIKPAMEYESSMQQINRIMGENAAGFVNWADTQANAYNMSRLEAVKYGAVYGNLMSSVTSSQAEATQYTTDLLKASAVVASATGRTMEDTMSRIRSGLLGNTEAVEDLGIQVQVSMLESTAAFRRFANGKSWEQLDFQTQQQIRLFAILEQATNKFGADVYNNTASSLMQFTALLKDVQLNIGQAFLPLVNTVMPILIRFANGLKYVTAVFSQFMQALFGVKTKQVEVAQTSAQMASAGNDAAGAQNNLAKATKAAGKAAKGSLAAFDEINQLQEQMADSGAGAAGSAGDVGGGGVTVPDMSTVGSGGVPENVIPLGILAAANSVRSALAGIQNAAISAGQFLKAAFGPSVQSAIKTLTPVFQNWKNALMVDFAQLSTLWGPFTNSLLTLVPVGQQAIGLLGNVFAGLGDTALLVFQSIFKAAFPILQWFASNGVPLLASFTSGALTVFQSLFDNAKAIFDTLWSGAIAPGLMLVSTVIVDSLNIIKGFWDKWGTDIVNSITRHFDSTKELFMKLWNQFLGPIVENMLTNLRWFWDKHLKGVVEAVVNFVATLWVNANEIWSKFVAPIIGFLIDTFGPVFSNIFNLVASVVMTAFGTIADVIKGAIKIFTGISDFITGVFTGDWQKAWEGVKEIFSGVWDGIVGVFKGAINLIIDGINFLIRAFNSIKFTIPSEIPGIGGKTIGMPRIKEIDKLAKGGIVASPTLAMIGEAGTEAVIPLENTSFVDTLSSSIATAIVNAMRFSQSNNSQGNTEAIIQIDSTKLARVLIPAINKENNRIGNTAIIQGV